MRYISAGESHGRAIVAILEGIPANLELDIDKINHELYRRQQGVGRGARMQIESDKIVFLAGVRGKVTTGAPIAFMIENKDYANNTKAFDPECGDNSLRPLTCLRPGHADYGGVVKFNLDSARNVLERASARETAARVAAGAIAKQFLEKLGIFIGSHTTAAAGIRTSLAFVDAASVIENADKKVLRCMDEEAGERMKKSIENLAKNGDTAGGEFQLIASGVPAGIGSHTQYDKKLDYYICGHLASLQGVKCVGIGAAGAVSMLTGSQTHDQMYLSPSKKICRKTNMAGGIEGGISNGENIEVLVSIKAIPSLKKPLDTVDISTMQNAKAECERSDVCVVEAAAVVGESILAFVIAHALVESVGGSFMQEVIERVNLMRERQL